MEIITIVLIGIITLFFILLALKNIFTIKDKFCVICASVTLTWTLLLALYILKIFTDKTIIAILMGQTSIGIFYLLENRVKEKVKLFRLPFLLSLIFIIYLILENFNFNSLIFIIILWAFFFMIYLFRTKKSIGIFFNKILECCKRW